MNKKTISQIFEIFSEQNPEPKTELNYINEYTLLIAIVLSAQATDIGVNKATKALFKVAITPEQILSLGENKLKTYIKTIGLFNSKAKNIIKLSHKLIESFHGIIPNNIEDLQSLAGVGRKTANVFLNCARGEPTIGVDTHVERVSNRIGIVKTKNPLQTEKSLIKNIPNIWKKHAHHWLILHGRYVCKARKPICGKCIISHLCKYKDKEGLQVTP